MPDDIVGPVDIDLCVEAPSGPAPWSPRELAWAQLVANLAVAYLGVVAERDEVRRAQRELVANSLRDPLTGVANRSLLFDRLTHALATAPRQGRTVGVLFIDLDGFKEINDTFGHAAGDSVLREVAGRMAAAVRGGDTLARLAGDEFVVVCEEAGQGQADQLESELGGVVARIRQSLQMPILVDGAALTVSASIGAARSDPAASADELLAEADAAMYREKQRRAYHHGAWNSVNSKT